MLSNDLMDELERLFSRLSEHVLMRNKQDRFDINKELEGFIKELLKLIGYYNLENLNIKKHNYSAIDLAGTDPTGDPVAIQITSTAANDKIKSTFDTFFKKNLDKKYGHNLLFIILHTTNRPNINIYKKINIKKNILNLTDILNLIADKDISTKKKILAYVNEEMKSIQTTQDFKYEFLEDVINGLLEKFDEGESGGIYNYGDFEKLPISKKIDKNKLSHRIKRKITNSFGDVKSVNDYLETRKKVENGIIDQLIGVLKIQYGGLVSRGKTGDEIFDELIIFVKSSPPGSGNPIEKYHDVGVALLIYFFEKCDIFKK